MYSTVEHCSKFSYSSVHFGNILEDAVIHNMQQDLPAICSATVATLLNDKCLLCLLWPASGFFFDTKSHTLGFQWNLTAGNFQTNATANGMLAEVALCKHRA